jgi:hypothetical protein
VATAVLPATVSGATQKWESRQGRKPVETPRGLTLLESGFPYSAMMKPIPFLFPLASLLILSSPSEGVAQPLNSREIREFMGVYQMKGRVTTYLRGELAKEYKEFPMKFRWTDNKIEVPIHGGSFGPVVLKVSTHSNSIQVRKILGGSGIDPDTGEPFEVLGMSYQSFTRRGARKYFARYNLRLVFGTFAYQKERLIGEKSH